MRDEIELRRRLAMVQQNRARSSRVRGIGALAGRVADRVRAADTAEPARVAEALAGVVDEEFRRHCRVGPVRGSWLIIHVDAHDLVYSMRVRWLYSLRGALGCRGRRFERIEFRYGTEGAAVPAAARRNENG